MRKIPAALLSLALTASLAAPSAAAAPARQASSLPELDGHWSQAAFERWYDYGIVEGDVRGMRPDASHDGGRICRSALPYYGLHRDRGESLRRSEGR